MRKIMLILVFLTAFVGSAYAQLTRVSGQVLSAGDDQPVIGATVRVQGTMNATATDADGRFTLVDIKASDKNLEVSYIGYETAIVPIKSDVKIYLNVSSEMMDEVIVVAFGKQKREAFTGSASVVSADEIMRQQVTNPIQALNGTVSGLNMLETNSFNSDPAITIRGIGSLNASTAPLIVLDGLPYNGYWNDINPTDIANITVLKDAASNALYGARGANGVILITSKSAERGKTKVSFNAKWGANTDGRVKYDVIDNAGEYYEAHYLALKNYYVNDRGQNMALAHINANNTLGAPYTEGGLGYMVYSVPQNQLLIGENGKINPNATLGNRVAYGDQIYTLYPDDWTDAGLRTGFRQEYNLNLSGGNDKFTFYGSLGYLDEEGIAYNNDIERYTARLKADYTAFPFLRVGMSSAFNHTTTNAMGEVFNTLTDVAPIYPLFIRDMNGNIMRDSRGKMYDYGNGDNAGLVRPVDASGNYIQEDLLDQNRNVSNAFNMQGYATFDFLNDFHFTANASVYVTENRINTAYNPYYGFTQSTGGSTSVYHYRTIDSNYQQLLNYSKNIGAHSIDVLLGHEYSRNSQTSLYGSRNNMAIFPTNKELDGAIIDAGMGSNVSDYNVEGYFLRAQYDYESRYFASGSFRRDGSSNFHPDHRWGNFWSVGGAWIMSKEEWFPKNWWLNMIKVKLSYGEQGNDGIGSFRYVNTYNISNSNGKVAFVFNTKGNENITWETVGSLNAGLEFELFNSRLSGGLEFYNRNTRDMLMWFSTPPSLGYSGYYDNIGDMRNTGIELELNADIITSRDITWSVGMNLTWEKNRVTRLPLDKRLLEVDGYGGYQDGDLFYGEGLPVNTWYLPRFAGLNENGESLFYRTNSTTGEMEATTNYETADRYLCGTALPTVFGGFNTTVKAFGFDLSAQFNYSIGGKKYDSTYASLMTPPYSTLTGNQLHRDVFNSWSPENPDSNIPRFQYNDQYTCSSSDRFLTDASYLGLRSINLGYTLPDVLVRKIGMSKLRVYCQAENVYYWTKRQGFDPRMGSLYGNYNSDSGYSFPMRTLSGGLSVEF